MLEVEVIFGTDTQLQFRTLGYLFRPLEKFPLKFSTAFCLKINSKLYKFMLMAIRHLIHKLAAITIDVLVINA